MFTVNELIAEQSDNPYTDEELENTVRITFANAPLVIASLDELSSFAKSRIRVWRSEFNRGLWNEKPVYKSFRYGPEGLPVNRNLKPLSAAHVAAEILSFPFDDPRKEAARQILRKGTNASTQS